jgi:hypothetical protein
VAGVWKSDQIKDNVKLLVVLGGESLSLGVRPDTVMKITRDLLSMQNCGLGVLVGD